MLSTEDKRERCRREFSIYCRDLNKITGGFSDDTLLENQHQLSFSEISDQAIALYPEILNALKAVDLCVIAHDHYECNPQYTHLGTYLINRYALNCDVFDVIGNALMPAHQTAKKIIERYFLCGKIESAIIFLL